MRQQQHGQAVRARQRTKNSVSEVSFVSRRSAPASAVAPAMPNARPANPGFVYHQILGQSAKCSYISISVFAAHTCPPTARLRSLQRQGDQHCHLRSRWLVGAATVTDRFRPSGALTKHEPTQWPTRTTNSKRFQRFVAKQLRRK